MQNMQCATFDNRLIGFNRIFIDFECMQFTIDRNPTVISFNPKKTNFIDV